jgi:hypothetical protein
VTSISYTYLIGWSKLDKWYYGVRYASNCNPDELWVKYKTSSKQLVVICPYCCKSGGKSNMIRHHFDNCKYKKHPHDC